MVKKLYIVSLSFVIFITFSCKNNRTSTAYFSGQIANPKEKSIQIIHNNKVLKTKKLDTENNFSIKLDSVSEGLFTFKHGDEIQYVYLMPKDSLVMRLNTWDFDESLIFSGKGSIRNNFLLHLFLENEKQEKLFYNYYSLNENKFTKKTDSLLQIKLLAFKQFKDNYFEKSEKFDALIDIAIHYPIYAQMEKYAANCRNKNKKLNPNYYNFRENISLNNKEFESFYAYRNYVKQYITNKSNQVAKKNTNKPKSVVILEQINTDIDNCTLKNELLQNATINCLLDERCDYNTKQKAIAAFLKNCSDKKQIKQIKNIQKGLEKFKKGEKLPELVLVNFKGNTIHFNANSIKNKTVIYFWPKERNRIVFMSKRVHYLKNKYPNITFIGIDGQLTRYNWIAYVKSNNLSQDKQYQLQNKNSNHLFSNDLPRAVILNKDGVIQNIFSFIGQKDFEKLLKII